jgi:excisionase family DNA binding protein
MPYSVLQRLEECDKALTVKQVAEIFGENKKKIYAMAAAQQLPCLRFGVRYKFDPATLAYWVKKQNPAFARAQAETKGNQAHA